MFFFFILRVSVQQQLLVPFPPLFHVCAGACVRVLSLNRSEWLTFSKGTKSVSSPGWRTPVSIEDPGDLPTVACILETFTSGGPWIFPHGPKGPTASGFNVFRKILTRAGAT